jgi:hypothetical protein
MLNWSGYAHVRVVVDARNAPVHREQPNTRPISGQAQGAPAQHE